MDETVGDVPSEGGDSSRRFGIYRAFTPEPRVFSLSRLSLLFIACVAGVVVFAVIFPMLQFASRFSRLDLPFPEIANKSTAKDTSNTNCSSNVFSFGHDCTITTQTFTEETITNITQEEDTTPYTETSQFETSTTSTTLDDSEVVAETRHVKILRTGRSGWPDESTPYPYYLPKPTQGITDRIATDEEEASVFAIPDGSSQENITSYLKSKPRVNFTPPPYAFTPFPNFTDSYAQLLPYKVTPNYTNLGDVLKFMKNEEDSNSALSTEKPLVNRRLSTMKVSGTYRMPLDHRRPDNPTSSSEKIEEARPFFNGHAYISDPFVKFRPANPIDVNRLVPLRPDIGSRFRRPYVKSKPQAEVPEESQDRDLHAAGESYTEAIFHGAGSVPQPSDLLTPPAPEPATSSSSSKPLSVTLDIYPVTMEMPVSEPPKGPSVPPWRDRGRFRNPQRPRWRPQAGRGPTGQTQPPPPQPPPPNPADNHMVVHLNLFPNRRKPYTFARRRGEENFHQGTTKATLLGRVHFGARSPTGQLEADRDSGEMRVTTAPLSTSTKTASTTAENLPRYSALTGDAQDRANEEISTLFVENISKNESLTTDGLFLENNATNITKNDFVKNDSTKHLIGLIDGGESFLEVKNETEGFNHRTKSTHGHISTSVSSKLAHEQNVFSDLQNGTSTIDNTYKSIENHGIEMNDDNAFESTQSFNDVT